MSFNNRIISSSWLCTIFLLLIVATTNAQSILGKYRFVEDSDKKQANQKSIITIQFLEKTFLFKAEQPGSLVEDEGTYQISSNTIYIAFNEMEQGRKKGNFTISNGMLTLPFKMLDNLSGSSTWQNTNIIPANAVTKDQIIEQAIAGSKTKAKWIAQLDNRANANSSKLKGGKAQAYYNEATLFYFKNFKWESLYGFAKAAQLQPTNAVYLNNFSKLLLELGRIYDAKVLLEEITNKFPNLASPWGNLAYLYYKLAIIKDAEDAIKKAMILNPDNGMYCYTWAMILEEKGNKTEAEKNFTKAQDLGYTGSENGSGGTKSISSKQNNNSVKPANSKAPVNNKNITKEGIKLADWAGTYQAKYLRARSGETAQEANTRFGTGMASTNMNLQTLACAKDFTMDISPRGNISGSGRVMYVYQGTAASPIIGMASPVLKATNGGFAANLKDGFQIREWTFTGTVDEKGNVEINGMPTAEMDLLNVGKWQKIKPWSVFPADASGAAMKGPFHIKLEMDKVNGPFVKIDKYLDLNDKLIKKLHYEGFIFKSENNIIPDCQYTEPTTASNCPSSEFIKTKVAMSPQESISIEATNTFTKGSDGVQSQQEMACNVSGDWSFGLATTSVEFHQDNSMEFTVGVGVDTESFFKGSPIGLSEKLELIYDTKCGWGVKGSAALKSNVLGTGKACASVEGVIFFNKGL